MRLLINDIKIDDTIQSRETIVESVVEEYAELMKSSVQFPALTVFYDGSTYWLADGFHRIFAAIIAGLTEVETEVLPGGRREAILHSVGANACHGLRRTNVDKRKSVMLLLNDPEWSLWSDAEVGRRCNVSNHFVAKVKNEVKVTWNIPSEKTYTTKHGTVTTMNTTNIGKTKVPKEDTEVIPYIETIDTSNIKQLEESTELTSSEADEQPNEISEEWYEEELKNLPKDSPNDDPIITMECDVMLSSEVFSVEVIPKTVLPMVEKLRNICDVHNIENWRPEDKLKLKSELEMLKCSIDGVLVYIDR